MPAPIDLDEIASTELVQRGRYRWRTMVCTSTSCLASSAQAVRAELELSACHGDWESYDAAAEALESAEAGEPSNSRGGAS